MSILPVPVRLTHESDHVGKPGAEGGVRGCSGKRIAENDGTLNPF